MCYRCETHDAKPFFVSGLSEYSHHSCVSRTSLASVRDYSGYTGIRTLNKSVLHSFVVFRIIWILEVPSFLTISVRYQENHASKVVKKGHIAKQVGVFAMAIVV